MTMLDQTLNCVRRVCAAAPAVVVSLLMAPAAYAEGQSIALGAGAAPNSLIIAQGYYEESLTKSCSNSSNCTLFYATVPVGKLLVVNHVSCRLNIFGTAAMTYFFLNAANRPTFLTPILIRTSAGSRIFQSSNEVVKLAQSGTAPIVSVVFTAVTNSDLQCLVAGQLITVPVPRG